jgi:hypothetical protein
VGSANEDTTICGGKSQGKEHCRQLGRTLRGKTVRGGEAGSRNERNTELISKEHQLTSPPSKNSQTIN